jgi:Niemann-Pick C1 protein
MGRKQLFNPIQMNFFLKEQRQGPVCRPGNQTTTRPNNQTSPCPEVDPLNYNMAQCDSDDPDLRCACVDCAKTCDLDLGELSHPTTCFIGNPRLDCLAFTFIILYAVFAVVVIMAMANVVLARRGLSMWKQRQLRRVEEEREPLVQSDSEVEGDSDETQVPFRPWPVDSFLQRVFFKLGGFCAHHPTIVLLSSLVIVVALSVGWVYFKVETNPINLWVDPKSEALAQKAYFDENFEPFYRITQLIITPASLAAENVFDWKFLNQVWKLQNVIEELQVMHPYENKTVGMKDLCFKPTGTACATQSFLGKLNCFVLSFLSICYCFFA